MFASCTERKPVMTASSLLTELVTVSLNFSCSVRTGMLSPSTLSTMLSPTFCSCKGHLVFTSSHVGAVQPVCPQDQPSTAEYAAVSILHTEEGVEQLKELHAPVTICSAVLCQHWQIEWYARVGATQRKNQVAAACHSIEGRGAAMQQNHTWAVAAQVLQLHVLANCSSHM